MTDPPQETIDWGPPRRKVHTWHDPTILVDELAGLSGRDFLQAIADGRLPNPPMAGVFGGRLEFVGDGEARLGCTPEEFAYNTLGMVQGGLLCVLFDFAATAAVHTLLPAGVGLSTVEIKVSFLAPVRAHTGKIGVHGVALRIGRRIGFAEAHARDGNGELVGHATSSVALIRPAGRVNAAAPPTLPV